MIIQQMLLHCFYWSVLILLIKGGTISFAFQHFHKLCKWRRNTQPVARFCATSKDDRELKTSSRFSIVPFREEFQGWRLSESFNSTTMKTIISFQEEVVSFVAKIENSLLSLRLFLFSKIERDLRTTATVTEYVTKKAKQDIEELRGFQQMIQKPLLQLPSKIQQLSSNADQLQLLLNGVDRGKESTLIAGLKEKTTKERAAKLRVTKQASLRTEEKIEGVLDLYQTVRVLPKRLEYDYQRRARKKTLKKDPLSERASSIRIVRPSLAEKVTNGPQDEPSSSRNIADITDITIDAELLPASTEKINFKLSEALAVEEEAGRGIDRRGSYRVAFEDASLIDRFSLYFEQGGKQTNYVVGKVKDLAIYLLDQPSVLLTTTARTTSSAAIFGESSPMLNQTYVKVILQRCDEYLAVANNLLSLRDDEQILNLSQVSLEKARSAIQEILEFLAIIEAELTAILRKISESREYASLFDERLEGYLAGLIARYSLSSENLLCVMNAWEEYARLSLYYTVAIRSVTSLKKDGESKGLELLPVFGKKMNSLMNYVNVDSVIGYENADGLATKITKLKELWGKFESLIAQGSKTEIVLPAVTLNVRTRELHLLADDRTAVLNASPSEAEELILDAVSNGEAILTPSYSQVASASSTARVVVDTTADVTEIKEKQLSVALLASFDVLLFLAETVLKTLKSLLNDNRAQLWERIKQTFDLQSSEEVIVWLFAWFLPAPWRLQLRMRVYLNDASRQAIRKEPTTTTSIGNKEWKLMNYFQSRPQPSNLK